MLYQAFFVLLELLENRCFSKENLKLFFKEIYIVSIDVEMGMQWY